MRAFFESACEALDLLPEARRRIGVIAAIERQKLVTQALPGGAVDAEALEARKRQKLVWFAEQGIVVREVAPALLDFPLLAYDRPVFLCWREGEHRFESWHELDGGYLGRYPIASLLAAPDLAPEVRHERN